MTSSRVETSPPLIAHHPDSPEFAALLARIAAGASDRERHRVNPHEQIGWLKEAGVGSLRLTGAYGGPGVTLRRLLDVVIRIARADANIAHALRSHYLVTESRLHLPADPWLRAAARGELFGIAVAEAATARIDSRDYTTTLRRHGDGWLLDGEKIYSTGSLFADWIQVPAVGEDGTVRFAFVHHDAAGVDHRDDWDGIGQRLTASGTTIFRSVAVPDDHVLKAELGLPGSSDPRTYRGTFAQLYLQAVLAGIAAASADSAAEVIRGRRRTFSHASAATAADDPLVQHIAGQIDGFAFTARAAVLVAAETLDAAAASTGVDGQSDPELLHAAALDVARTKPVVEDLALRAATLLFEAGGASTATVRQNLDRHWRNARTVASHNPTVFKTRAVGDHLVNGARLPGNGFF
ncbi:acyl-CoA dehydrogenase family protein [Acrocarpospora catenulata]|uniref:acyl-CoA dehydrogenase family protein n=1 Tax=Acrocarpospora catenulata TaxID=2836182 RepID=UPI001BDB180F|nr:acyl-CoA dehydrogenase family protein [Acrocarpospora catenulata]